MDISYGARYDSINGPVNDLCLEAFSRSSLLRSQSSGILECVLDLFAAVLACYDCMLTSISQTTCVKWYGNLEGLLIPKTSP